MHPKRLYFFNNCLTSSMLKTICAARHGFHKVVLAHINDLADYDSYSVSTRCIPKRTYLLDGLNVKMVNVVRVL